MDGRSESVRHSCCTHPSSTGCAASLCDSIFLDPSPSGQETLENLERANLFIVPLDNERRWYRYHHLFADLLRQRLREGAASSTGGKAGPLPSFTVVPAGGTNTTAWDFEAFRHAAAANDIERAERLIEGKGIPLHFRGAVAAILEWLASLPKTVMDARPSLCVRYATLSLVAGQLTGARREAAGCRGSPAGRRAERQGPRPDRADCRPRATLALTRYEPEAMITQARRALEYLRPDSLFSRIRAIWTLGFACQVQGDRAAAGQAYSEAIAISQASGNIRMTIVATISLGAIQEMENDLHRAAETFRSGLQLAR